MEDDLQIPKLSDFKAPLGLEDDPDRSPEERLVLAVLARAVCDYAGHAWGIGGKMPRAKINSLKKWLFWENDPKRPFSFLWCAYELFDDAEGYVERLRAFLQAGDYRCLFVETRGNTTFRSAIAKQTRGRNKKATLGRFDMEIIKIDESRSDGRGTDESH